MLSPLRTRSSSFTRNLKPPLISASSDTTLTLSKGRGLPCVKRPRSSWWAKCAIAYGRSRAHGRGDGSPVLATLHTVDAGQSINRILGLFSPKQKQLRIRLADTLRYVISQRLAPKVGGARQLLMEILGHNLRTEETIVLGEDEQRNFYEIIEASAPFGWMTFDQSILAAYENDLITEETANSSPRANRVSPRASI